jgi:hypothetical protein
MDEEPGKVIDGTARARQWRSSRSRPSPEPDRDEARSNAPKSLAASLLVPAEMLDGALAPGEASSSGGGDEAPVADGGTSAATDALGGDEGNLFLSPDAAIDQPSRRPNAITGLLHLLGVEVARLRAVLRLPARRNFSPPRPRRVAVGLGAVALVALVVWLVAQSQTHSPATTHASGGLTASVELGGLNQTLLPSIARALAAAEAAGQPRSTHARSARRRARHRPAVAHKAIMTVSTTPVSSSYTPTPTGASAPEKSVGASSNSFTAGSVTAPPSTPAASPARTSGGSTSAFGSSGVLGPGSSPNG